MTDLAIKKSGRRPDLFAITPLGSNHRAAHTEESGSDTFIAKYDEEGNLVARAIKNTDDGKQNNEKQPRPRSTIYYDSRASRAKLSLQQASGRDERQSKCLLTL